MRVAPASLFRDAEREGRFARLAYFRQAGIGRLPSPAAPGAPGWTPNAGSGPGEAGALIHTAPIALGDGPAAGDGAGVLTGYVSRIGGVEVLHGTSLPIARLVTGLPPGMPVLLEVWSLGYGGRPGAVSRAYVTPAADDSADRTLIDAISGEPIIDAISGDPIMLAQQGPGPTEIAGAILTSGRSAEGIAPEGITFAPDYNAIGTHFGISAPTGAYDRRKHDLRYVWTFGDPGEFVAPQNIIAAHKNSNTMVGFKAAHVYRSPGTYIVRLDVYGTISGEPAHVYSERTVTIGNQESIFAGTKTYFVSPSSNWANAPVGAQRVTSLDDAAGWANEDGAAGPYRIMLNRGEAYSFGGRRFGFNTPVASTIHVVPGPGAGALPILTCTGGFAAGANDDPTYVNKTVVFQGLDLLGPYDPVTPGDPEVTSSFAFWGPYSPCQILIDRCEMHGFGHFYYIGDNAPRHIYLNDCVEGGYGQWGLFGSHYTGLAMLGCRTQSHPDAPIDNGINMGGTFRTGGGAESTIIAGNDIGIRQGWSGLGGGYIAVQPCIRLEADGTSGAEMCITRNALEGGFTMLSISRGDDPSVVVNALVEDNYLLGGYQTSSFVGASCGGVTVRNNVAVIPATTQRVGPGLGAFVDLGHSGPGDVLAAPMQVYGNTIVNYTSGTLGVVSNPAGYTAVVNQNNLVHQPNASPPQASDAPLATTPALWTPRERGYRSTTVPLMADTATPAGAAASYAPAAGSAALGAATSGLIPPHRIDGAERADPPNRGAW